MGFHALDRGFQVLDSGFFVWRWNLDSMQDSNIVSAWVESGFLVSYIPHFKAQDSRFHGQNLLDSGFLKQNVPGLQNQEFFKWGGGLISFSFEFLYPTTLLQFSTTGPGENTFFAHLLSTKHQQ